VIIAEGAATHEVTELIQDLADVPTLMVTTLMFAELSPVASPTGILALVNVPQLPLPQSPHGYLFLEDIQDPGNLGSMLRSAAAAGVDAVYLSQGCAEAWSPKALRGGQGAQFVLPIVEGADLQAEMARFNGQTLAMSMRGESLYAQDLTQPTAFLIGNEGAGLSDILCQKATKRVHIPMRGKVESLNAAAAASVCVFEFRRQQES
jgi:RNA methyltransferase, TrmH family